MRGPLQRGQGSAAEHTSFTQATVQVRVWSQTLVLWTRCQQEAHSGGGGLNSGPPGSSAPSALVTAVQCCQASDYADLLPERAEFVKMACYCLLHRGAAADGARSAGLLRRRLELFSRKVSGSTFLNTSGMKVTCPSGIFGWDTFR